MEPLRLNSAAGRWVLAASVLGSGAVFVESSVVNVALPAIARDFGLGIEGLQWVVNGYLLTLSALMLLGGALGDHFRRPTVFAIGCIGFAAASAGCALATGPAMLVVLRLVQGAAGALLVPNSLAMLETAFASEDRGTAIGQWAAWSAVSTAAGPLLGGWLVDAASWRWVFASVVVLPLAAAWIVLRHAPGTGTGIAAPLPASGQPSRGEAGGDSVDYLGAVLVTLGLAGVVGALIEGPRVGFTRTGVLAAGLGGVALLGAFVAAERRVARRGGRPLLPFAIFRSRQFTGANLTTLLVYAALGGLFFLLMPQLQNNLGYSALQAGAALLPVNAFMLLLSPPAGRLSARIGPRLPMAGGALVAAAGMLLFARIRPGASYLATVLPAAIVFGVGLAALVAPLTTAVLGAVGEREAGMASGINNAVARLAGLVATAALPLAAGLGGLERLDGPAFTAGFVRAMWISAGLCAAGAVVALVTIRRGARPAPAPVTHPSLAHGCTPRPPAPAVRSLRAGAE
jgi:EmrB/QacA subfamily drug resistance transporter